MRSSSEWANLGNRRGLFLVVKFLAVENILASSDFSEYAAFRLASRNSLQS